VDENTAPPVDPYKLDAYEVKQIAKALEQMNAISTETGVNLCALGDAQLGIGDTTVRFRSTGTGRETRYELDLRQY